MRTEYRRDTHHSYLVLYEPEGETVRSFRERMFLENRIPGFLQCRRHEIDQCGRFFYDISSRQSLANVLETRTLDQNMLEALVRSLLTALGGLQDFLLDTEGLSLQPERIFLKPAEDAFEFCYFPEGAFSWKEEFRQFAEYLLPHLEHKNREAVHLGYALYQNAMEEKTTAAELEQLLAATAQPEQTWRRPARKEAASEELPGNRSELLNSFFEPGEEAENKKENVESGKSGILRYIWLLLPAVVGSLGAFACWYFALDLLAAACGVLGVLGTAGLFLQKWKKKKEEETDTRMEQYVMMQDWMEEDQLEEKEEVKEKKDPQEQGEAMTCYLGGGRQTPGEIRGYLVPQPATKGPAIPIEKKVTMIGKSNHMDVILPVPAVSRTHARITGLEGNCFLTDMNSKNGTKVNGMLLDPEEHRSLSDGDQIVFADQCYQWKLNLL